jgi:hypothetical protein
MTLQHAPLNNVHEPSILVGKAHFYRRCGYAPEPEYGLNVRALNLKLQDFPARTNYLRRFTPRM